MVHSLVKSQIKLLLLEQKEAINQKKGLNLVLWILPGAGIGIGLLWVMILSKRWVTKPQLEELAQLTPEEERKLKEDLERFEGG